MTPLQDVQYNAELILATLMEAQAHHYVEPPAPEQAGAGTALRRGPRLGHSVDPVVEGRRTYQEAETPAAGHRGAAGGAVPPPTAPHVPGDTPWHRDGEW